MTLQPHQPHVRYTADKYDEYTSTQIGMFDDMLAASVIEEMRGRPAGSVLLDVGTGTARLLVVLAARPELAHVRLVGSDVFDDMVERARVTVADAGLSDRIELRQDDVHAMRLPDDYADVILSRSTIHHWTDPVRAFREIYRVLTPGGVAKIQDVRRDPAPEAIAEFNRRRALAGIPPSFLDEKFTVAEVTAFVEQAGLQACAKVKASDSGIAALGYEVRIRKPAV